MHHVEIPYLPNTEINLGKSFKQDFKEAYYDFHRTRCKMFQ